MKAPSGVTESQFLPGRSRPSLGRLWSLVLVVER
jgi:hypothetical protein